MARGAFRNVIRILDRMVGKTFLTTFALVLLGIPILFIVGDAVERLQTYLNRGLTTTEMLLGYLYMAPNFILWSFPIAALVAAVFTVHKMTTNLEVVAAKAGGVSFHRLVAPIFVLGFLLTGVGLWLTSVVPETNRRSAVYMGEQDARRAWRDNFVFRTEDGRSLSVSRLRAPAREMLGVAMAWGDPLGGDAATHVTASAASYVEDEGWVFRDGFMRKLYADGEEASWSFDVLKTRGLQERPEQLLEEPTDDEQMTYAELGRLARVIERSGGDPAAVRVARERKVAIPVATLVIVLFGAPLATTSKRGGATFGIGIALASTILYLILFRVFESMGETGAVSPMVAAWTPNLLFGVTGLILLSRVRT